MLSSVFLSQLCKTASTNGEIHLTKYRDVRCYVEEQKGPLDVSFRGRYVPLDDASLTHESRAWTAYRRWMITTATRFAWVALGALRVTRAKPRLVNSNLTYLIMTSAQSQQGMGRTGVNRPIDASAEGRIV